MDWEDNSDHTNCPFLTVSLWPCLWLIKLSGVGGIEAEAVMLNQCISMVLPKVVGYKLSGKMDSLATSTDVVLTITKVWSLSNNNNSGV